MAKTEKDIVTTIELLSSLAAKKFLDKKFPSIKEAILDTISQEQGLTEEAIRRICEKTNSNIAQSFLSSEMRTAKIPLANPEEIIKEVIPAEKAEAQPSDYSLPPQAVLRDFENNKDRLLRKSLEDIAKKVEKDPYDDPAYVPPRQKIETKYEACKIAEDWAASELRKLALEKALSETYIKNQLENLIRDKRYNELEKVAGKIPEVLDYIKEVALEMIKRGETVLPFMRSDMDSYLNETEVDETNPFIKALYTVIDTKEKIDALMDVLSTIQKTKEDTYKKLVNQIHG